MPGIAGIFNSEHTADCERLVEAMVASMRNEPFYVSGTHATPGMGIYVGWVAHKNSFAANQVFLNEQHDIALIVAGECFVDSNTLIGLRKKGHRIENENDWIVHLYEEKGEQLFEKLNGLFSGVLIDKRLGKAFLFNDRFGVERIYWHENHRSIYFASEAKALLRVLPELRTFDEKGVAQFFGYGCTLEGRTLFQGIQLLPGASLWSFEGGRSHERRTYFSSGIWELQPLLSAEAFEARFQETFERIVPRYFESDSVIGISLTGGLDTRMIMACLPDAGKKPLCYTFSGETGETFDDRLAAEVARACGFEHRLLRIGVDFFSDFASHVDRTVYATDGCLGATGAHEIYLNSLARQFAPTRLTGNYGSEILRGVSTFKRLGLSPRLLNRDFATFTDLVAKPVTKENPVTFAAFHEVPLKLFGSLAASRSQVVFRSPYLDNELVALAYQAPNALRRSQDPGLLFVKNNNDVLSKIPTDKGYVSDGSRLAEFARRCFSRVTFKLDYFYNEGFPNLLSPFDPYLRFFASTAKILGLHKYLHYRIWFRRELAPYVQDVLGDSRTRQMPFWDSTFLEYLASEHIRGRKNYVLEIDAVLTLEAVDRLLFRELPRSRANGRCEKQSSATPESV